MNEKTNKETRQTSLHDDNVKLSLSVKDVTNKRKCFSLSEPRHGPKKFVSTIGLHLPRWESWNNLDEVGKNTSSLSLWHVDFFVAVAAVLRKLSSTPGSLLDPLLFLIHIYSVTKNNISDCLLNDDKNSHLKSQRTWYHFFIKTKSRSYEEQGLSMEINSPL